MPRVYFPETQWEMQISRVTPSKYYPIVVLKFSLPALWLTMVKTKRVIPALFERIGSDHLTHPSMYHSIWVQCSIGYRTVILQCSENYQAKLDVYPLLQMHVRYSCNLVVRTVGRKHTVACSNPHIGTGLFHGCCFFFSP